MKKGSFFIALLLASLFLSNTFRVSITYAYYNLDTEGFIERLCVNKDKPVMQCNGKCHLKMVAQADTDNQQTPVQRVSIKEIPFYLPAPIEYSLSEIEMVTVNNLGYQNFYAYLTSYSFYHPPQV